MDYCEYLLLSGDPKIAEKLYSTNKKQKEIQLEYNKEISPINNLFSPDDVMLEKKSSEMYSMDGIKELLEEKLRFSVSLGGFDTEPFEAKPIHPSPQIRLFLPRTNTKVPIFTVDRQFIFKVASFNVEHFSAQSKQDLQISLSIGDRQVFVSGLVLPISQESSSPVQNAGQVRVFSYVGMPLTSIAVIGGSGYPDNFPRKENRTHAVAFEGDNVSWQIVNQSDVYSHSIKLELYGWSFPMQGRTKEEILKDLAS